MKYRTAIKRAAAFFTALIMSCCPMGVLEQPVHTEAQEKILLEAVKEDGEIYAERTWTAGNLSIRYQPETEEEVPQFVFLPEEEEPGEESSWLEMEEDDGYYITHISGKKSGKYRLFVRMKREAADPDDEKEEAEGEKNTPEIEQSWEFHTLDIWLDNSKPVLKQVKLCEDAEGNGKYSKEIISELEGNKLTGRDFAAVMEAEDEHSGVDGFWYKKNSTDEYQFCKTNENGRTVIKLTPGEAETFQGEFSAYAADQAGNYSEEKKISYFYDAGAPDIDLLGMVMRPLNREGHVVLENIGYENNKAATWQKYGVELTGIHIRDVDNETGLGSGLWKVWAEREGKRIDCEVIPAMNTDAPDLEEKQVSLRIRGNSPGLSGDRIKIVAEDRAGNRAVSAGITVKIDGEDPEPVDISLNDTGGEPLLPFPAFRENRYFSSRPIVVRLRAKDRISGVRAIWYRIGSGKEYRRIEGNEGSFLLKPGFHGKVSAYAEDYAGNTGRDHPAVSGMTVSDCTQPGITIEADRDLKKWQREKIHFRIGLKENPGNAGLEHAVVRINDRIVQERDYTKGLSPVYEDQLSVSAAEESGTEEGYYLETEVWDLAGNHSTARRHIRIDRSAPQVELSGAENGEAFRTDKKLEVRCSEQNYHGTVIKAEVIRNMPGSGKSEYTREFSMKREEDRKELMFSEEGAYTVRVWAEDAAFNSAEVQRLEFTIDKTAPEIRVEGPQEGSFHNRPEQVRITVDEAFYENNQVEITCERTLDGHTDRQSLKAWENSNIHSAWQQDFREDGVYRLTVHALDQAGNQSKSGPLTFTIDRTSPKLDVLGADNYEIMAHPARLSLQMEEAFYENASVVLEAEREDQNGKVETLPLKNIRPDKKLWKQEYILSRDGIYRLKISGEDQAGNKAEKNFNLVIDTKNPVIRYVNRLDGRYMREFRLPQSVSLVEDLTLPKFRMYLNGLEHDMGSVVKKEGRYRLRLDAEDEAGHQASAAADFIIDRTPPEIFWKGPKDGGTEYGPVELSLKVEEGERIEKLYINGRNQLEKPIGEYTERFWKKGSYRLKAETVDLAGNRKSEERKFTIAAKGEEKGSQNKMAVFLSAIVGIAAAAIVAAGIPALLLYRKKTP